MKRMSAAWGYWWQKDASKTVENVPIKILGNRNSGKTTFLYKIYFKYKRNQHDEPFEVVRTDLLNVQEGIPFRDMTCTVWDFGELGYALNYMKNTRVLLYMLDSVEQNKPEVYDKNKQDLLWLLDTYAEDLKETIIITIANKQDHADAMPVFRLADLWMKDEALSTALKTHQWAMFPCAATSGMGIDVVLEYIYRTVSGDAKAQSKSQAVPISPTGGPSKPLAEYKTSLSSSGKLGSTGDDNSSSRSSSTVNVSGTTVVESPTTQKNLPIAPWDQVPNPYHLRDREFLQWFDQGKQFLFFDHTCLVRIAYIYLRNFGSIPGGNNEATRRLIERLQDVLKVTAPSDSVADKKSKKKKKTQGAEFAHESIEFSETSAFFWMAMVSYAMIKHPVQDGEGADFERFFMTCPELWDEDVWRIHYSASRFKSEQAKKEFMPPDRKPLPNAFKASSVFMKGSGLSVEYKVVA